MTLPPPRPLPKPLQAWRAARVSLHVFAGVATTSFVFPLVKPHSRRRLTRRWCLRLLRLLKVEARMQGVLDGEGHNVMIVANHISWLDIFVLNAYQPARFVAKSELASWPVVGRMIRGAGTIFIERTRKRDTQRANEQAAAVLAGGDVMVVFPEGTTTDGTGVLKFHGSLLQPIVDAEGHVQPVAIRYRDPHGRHSLAPEYVGDTTFAQSFWRVCGERALVVELHVTERLHARARHRRELAHAAETAIRTALVPPAAATAPGTPAGPAGAPR
jgi:1-acyl-sn-glycerol-3-phosphate acyltransferase